MKKLKIATLMLIFTHTIYAGEVVPHNKIQDTLSSLASPHSQCDTTEIQRDNADKIIVMFEGKNGFTDIVGDNFKKMVANNPQCYTQSSEEDGKNDRVQIGRHIFNRQDLKNYFYIQASGKKFVLDYLCSSQTPELKTTKILLYRSDVDCDEVRRCVNDIKSEIPESKLIMMGFSHGAHRAVTCANHFSEHKVLVNLGITFDPVPLSIQSMVRENLLRAGFRGVTNYLSRFQNSKGSPDYDSYAPDDFIIPNESYWFNFWQEDDSRFGITGLTGFGINNATYNKRVIIKGDALEHAHWNIMNDTHATEMVFRALRSVK